MIWSDDPADLDQLLTAAAVRARAGEVLAAGLAGELSHFRVELSHMAETVDLVRRITEESYPDGKVPFHSRWRHFETQAGDLWAPSRAILDGALDRLRARIDLAVASVLLDAGAGPDWRYHDAATGLEYTRSEGLAVASLRMFEAGAFSAAPGEDPLRADATRLVELSEERLAEGMQAGPNNPLIGLAARAELLRNLGARMIAHPAFAHADGSRRIGNLFVDVGADISASDILERLLDALNPVWPDGLLVEGRALGDVGRHGRFGLLPFHKLSQWLAYSLIEPIQELGARVTDIDGLTGLPEYRNGGLFLDTGVLALLDSDQIEVIHPDDSELVVEWRALTVALLDRLAEDLRGVLGQSRESLPLACVLQGGTWTAGRWLARSRGGRPPLKIATSGTRF